MPESSAPGAMDRNDGGADDRLAIRELIDNWMVWRDAGMWEKFRHRLAR